MSFQTLVVNDATLLNDWLSQIDLRLPVLELTVDPPGVVGVKYAGLWAYNKTAQTLWLCTHSDGTGNPAGTTWVEQSFATVPATDSAPGVIEIATQLEVNTGTNYTKAVTPLTLATAYARSGVNNDINQINGLSTPLSRGQGGTGVTSIASFIATYFPSMTSKVGYNLSNDGAGNLQWNPPNRDLSYVLAANATLVAGSYNYISGNNLTFTLPPSPAVGDSVFLSIPAGITNTTITRAAGVKIEGVDGDLIVDYDRERFALEWSGTTYGWTLK